MFRPARILLKPLAACAALILWSATPASSQGIALIVNGQPILSSEVQARLGLMKLSGGGGGLATAQDELVNEKLKVTEAKRFNITTPQDQVDAAFKQIAERSKLTAAQFSQAIQQRGVSPQTLKDRIGAEMTWAELVRRKYAGQIASRKTGANIADPSAKPKSSAQWTVRQIVFVLPKGATEAQFNQRRSEANAARARFPGCDKAVEFAGALRDVAVKEPITRSADQLGGFSQVLEKTKVGALTEPQKNENGIEMIAVCDRKDLATDDIYRTSGQIDENDGKALQAKSEQYLAQLKARAVIERR